MINQEIQRGTAVAWESEETESQLTTVSLLSIDARFESGFILRGNGAKLLETIQCSTKWYFNFVLQSVYSVKEHRWSGERNLLWSLSWLAVPNTSCFTALWGNIDTFCRWCVIFQSPSNSTFSHRFLGLQQTLGQNWVIFWLFSLVFKCAGHHYRAKTTVLWTRLDLFAVIRTALRG